MAGKVRSRDNTTRECLKSNMNDGQSDFESFGTNSYNEWTKSTFRDMRKIGKQVLRGKIVYIEARIAQSDAKINNIALRNTAATNACPEVRPHRSISIQNFTAYDDADRLCVSAARRVSGVSNLQASFKSAYALGSDQSMARGTSLLRSLHN